MKHDNFFHNFGFVLPFMAIAAFVFSACDSPDGVVDSVSFTVNFDANAGAAEVTGLPDEKTAPDGSSITRPTDPVRTGYTFTGWYENEECGGAAVIWPYTVTKHGTLYAKWEQNQYKVTFNGNSASGGTPPAPLTGAVIILPNQDNLIKIGREFAGWNINSSGTGNNYEAGASYTPTANITLYAKWIVPSPVVNFADLQDLYDEYSDIDSAGYIDYTLTAFEVALVDAEQVLNNNTSTQTEVNAALIALNEAIKKLRLKYPFDDSYSPYTFNKNTMTYTETKLSDGVRMIKTSYTRNYDPRRIDVYTVEVDLNLADVRVGATRAPGTEKLMLLKTVYNHMTDWEADNPGKKVIAGINGDFFDPDSGGRTWTRNALVKDGDIINPRMADLYSKSGPHMFGVKGDYAQIALMKPINGNFQDNVWDLLNSSLSYDAYNNVKSETGTWNGYTTIMGGDAALVLNGQIPATVAQETSNAASNINVPRTAVAVKGGNIVVLMAVESLYYGGKGTDDDSRGMAIIHMADFLRYYGVTHAFNLDGGGSTNMIFRDGYNGSGTSAVAVRSSDTGSSSATSARAVANALLVVTR